MFVCRQRSIKENVYLWVGSGVVVSGLGGLRWWFAVALVPQRPGAVSSRSYFQDTMHSPLWVEARLVSRSSSRSNSFRTSPLREVVATCRGAQHVRARSTTRPNLAPLRPSGMASSRSTSPAAPNSSTQRRAQVRTTAPRRCHHAECPKCKGVPGQRVGLRPRHLAHP